MTNIVLCPKCGGLKVVPDMSRVADDVNNAPQLYTCYVCDGRGWIQVDSVLQEDFVAIKSVALSAMETAENMMDECTKRADRIKELETELEYMVAGERAADKEVERLRAKISDIEGREDLVTTELERRACVAEDKLRVIIEMRDELLEDWEKKRYAIVRLESDISQYEAERKLRIRREGELFDIIDDLTDERERDAIDIELLDVILKTLNPLIKSGAYAKPSAEGRLLAIRMHGLCQTVVQFRRKHGIVG